MNRRGFLSAILAAGVAPYVVTTAGILMPTTQILTLSALAMEDWVPNSYGEVALEWGNKVILHAHSLYDSYGRPTRHNTFIATGKTTFAGTLKGQPGRVENGIFVPAAMVNATYGQPTLPRMPQSRLNSLRELAANRGIQGDWITVNGALTPIIPDAGGGLVCGE